MITPLTFVRCVLLQHTGLLMGDLSLTPLIVILFVCAWRAPACISILKNEESWLQKLGSLLQQVLWIFIDIPCFVLAIFLVCTLIKAPAVIKVRGIVPCPCLVFPTHKYVGGWVEQHTTLAWQADDFSNWHLPVAHMGFDCVLELLTLPVLATLAGPIFPLTFLWMSYTEELPKHEENKDYPFSHYYTTYRRAVIMAFFTLLGAIVMLSIQVSLSLLLLIPLLSWNHKRARSRLSQVWSSEEWECTPFSDTPLGKVVMCEFVLMSPYHISFDTAG